MTTTLEIEIGYQWTPMFFERTGIIPMLYINGEDNEDDNDELLVTWDDLFDCAKQSSKAVCETETIVSNLRALADRIEEWDKQQNTRLD